MFKQIYLKKGWIIKKRQSIRGQIPQEEIVLKRIVPLSDESFEEAIDYASKKLKTKFPKMTSAVKEEEKPHSDFLKSVEVRVSDETQSDELSFFLRLTPKEIHVKTYGLTVDSVLECLT